MDGPNSSHEVRNKKQSADYNVATLFRRRYLMVLRAFILTAQDIHMRAE